MEDHPDVTLTPAQFDRDAALVRSLFTEYARSLPIDLCFQQFEQELESLPGQYAEPAGSVLLAWAGAQCAGCCALRPATTSDYPDAAEMKRLYVRPGLRSLGLGRLLAEGTLDWARQAGYRCVLLDTLSEMEAARALYDDLCFVEIPPYYHNPIPGAHYLMARL